MKYETRILKEFNPVLIKSDKVAVCLYKDAHTGGDPALSSARSKGIIDVTDGSSGGRTPSARLGLTKDL
jgi:hypothetical protein